MKEFNTLLNQFLHETKEYTYLLDDLIKWIPNNDYQLTDTNQVCISTLNKNFLNTYKPSDYTEEDIRVYKLFLNWFFKSYGLQLPTSAYNENRSPLKLMKILDVQWGTPKMPDKIKRYFFNTIEAGNDVWVEWTIGDMCDEIGDTNPVDKWLLEYTDTQIGETILLKHWW